MKPVFYLSKVLYAGVRLIPIVNFHELRRLEKQLDKHIQTAEKALTGIDRPLAPETQAYMERLIKLNYWKIKHLREGAPLRNWREEYRMVQLFNNTVAQLNKLEAELDAADKEISKH